MGGATWGTRAGTVGSCAQAPDGTGSSQTKMGAGSGKAFRMPSTVRGMHQAQEGLEPSGETGCLERDGIHMALCPPVLKGPLWISQERAQPSVRTPAEKSKTSLICCHCYRQLRPWVSASTKSCSNLKGGGGQG